MNRKILVTWLLAVLALCGGVCAFAAQPTLQSQSACLMDADTGEILFEKDAQAELPPASITKVMTALLVLENGDLNGTVTASAEAINSVDLDSTRVGFEPGETLSVDTLMYCMLVDSANDAANILAEYVGGDLNTFVEKMNAKAEALGCTHTHFVNPNGLDTDGHYSCAHDMVLIMRAASQYPAFSQYASAVSYELPADNVIPAGWQIFTKVNMLCPNDVTYDARVSAGKTGWTTNAHNTFVASAACDDANLIVCVMNCLVKNGIFTDTSALLNYGTQAYECLTLQPEDYRKQAKQAAKEADCRIDTDALEAATLRLPSGMSAEDLLYTCETGEDGRVSLAVGIAPDSRKAYADATGMDGTQTLLQLPLTLKNQKTELGSAAASSQSDTQTSLPVAAKNAIMVAAIVLGAIVLLLLLGFYQRLRQRARRKKQRKRRK